MVKLVLNCNLHFAIVAMNVMRSNKEVTSSMKMFTLVDASSVGKCELYISVLNIITFYDFSVCFVRVQDQQGVFKISLYLFPVK